MYTLKFENLYKESIWGGNKLKTLFNREITSNKTGESWDVSCIKNNESIISNGKYKNKQMSEVIFSEQYMGTKILKEEFPLLIKIIDANDNLSVQVHPNDDYANKIEKVKYGKTEMWYILDAVENSHLIVGTVAGTTKEIFEDAIKNETVEQTLNKVLVKKGDIINVKAGTIHAITKGIVLLEVQQSSDITYRVFDYNRKDLNGNERELHVNKALDVINFDSVKNEPLEGIFIEEDENKTIYYIANKYFCIIKHKIKKNMKCFSNEERFYILTCVEGSCIIKNNGIEEKLLIGESIFIPAKLGEYNIIGKCEIIKSFVPDIENDFIKPLIAKGFTLNDIKNKTYIEECLS